LVSHRIAFSLGIPIAFKSSKQAIPAAPAPLTTILAVLRSFPTRSNALIRAAAEIMNIENPVIVVADSAFHGRTLATLTA
jgi:ABC-type phosphate/phosphonate transport system permease subunit